MENTNKECEINIFYFNSGNIPSSCGYCKIDNIKHKSSYSFGFSSEELSPGMYEDLMFLGWRRCGEYVYRPNLEKSCCKLYSCRLDINRFKINKNQRRVMKNFRKYLVGEEIKNKTDSVLIENVEMIQNEELFDKYEVELKNTIKNFISSKFLTDVVKNNEINLDFKVVRNKNPDLGEYSSNIYITTYYQYVKRNKDICIFKDQTDFYRTAYDKFMEYINQYDPEFCKLWKFSISEKTGHLNFFINEEKKSEMHEFQKILIKKLLEKNSNGGKKLEYKKKNILPEDEYTMEFLSEIVKEPKISKTNLKHNYTLEIEPNSKYSEEKFLVYKKYQMAIHKDKEIDLTPDRYINSWGSSNLSKGKKFSFINSNPLHPNQLGTWDLIHRIDGRIMAVGVLDILPTSVSSVYLYYDPEFSFLNPGVFTAIREIELIQEFQKNLDNKFKYYVMGFYIHTCPKMKYKGDYFPTELLCPVTLIFTDLNKVLIMIESNKYVKISDNPKKEDMDISEDELKLIMNSLILTYMRRKFNLVNFVNKYVTNNGEEILKNMKNLVRLVGKENIKRFRFYVK